MRTMTIVATAALCVAVMLALGGLPTLADDTGREQNSTKTQEVGLIPGVPLSPHDVDTTSKVGVIDSGVRQNHPQIGNAVGAIRDFTGEGLGDPSGHGTKVVLVLLHSFYVDSKEAAALIPNIRLFEVEVAKIIGTKRASSQEIANRMAEAIVWLSELGVQTVNISISLPDGAADYTALCSTIASHDKMVFSIAAGNSGPDVVVYPAACSALNEIVVGALKDGSVPEYSGPADIVANLPPQLVRASFFREAQASDIARLCCWHGAEM